MTGPAQALAHIIWIALAMIVVVGLAVGGFVFWYTGNGIAGLAAMLTVCALGLAALRWL